ncbi:hypothetical protein JX265_012071 [Neoarthrinium moseri]|uniref:NAD(P)-binding protein n=1 Tax=Neoarthrinium moseri TaxID=1658444 RepID=A0A9P9WB98_9PEZI|nr:hypothetical protein JX265_012071 [Neoarthrinium moseri]
MKQPIRVGILGLSAGGSWAVAAHLPYLNSSAKYSITAVCNSSVESSKAAIEKYGLPSSAKAYGRPEDLAGDADVDLVLCSINVALHHPALLPVLKAGKDVYCEWPLGSNLKQAEELNRLAKENGCKTIIGLQGGQCQVVNTLKEILAQGRIGNILSSTFAGAAQYVGPEEQEDKAYFFQAGVGGNLATIFFGHTIHIISSALGELSSHTSILDTKIPTVDLTDKPSTDPSRKVVRTVKRETHDQVLLQGRFESGALLSYHLYGGKAFAPGEGLHWRILGDRGELSITASGTNLQMGFPDCKIRLFDNRKDTVEEIPLVEDEWTKLPIPAQNTARIYEAFADGRTGDYPDWDLSIQRHKLIDEMYKGVKGGW